MTDWLTSGTWQLGDLERKRLEAVLDCVIGDSLCDLGTRDGTFPLRVAWENPNRRVVGIDTDEKGIAWANEQAIKLGLENFVAHTMDLFNAASLGTFDTIVLMEVLEHLDPKRVEEAFDLALGMATKRLIITVPSSTHISDPDHRTVFYREMFHGRPGLHWVVGCPYIWAAFYVDKEGVTT